MNHFRATHKKTGEQIEFGLENIWSSSIADVDNSTSFGQQRIVVKPIAQLYINERGTKNNLKIDWCDIGKWLNDYKLEYNHEGLWFAYTKHEEVNE